MSWGSVELEDEVRDWYLSLREIQRATVEFNIDRLAAEGPLLGEPFTKQLDGKLRELRFYVNSHPIRVTYWIAPGRRIILLTVFMKTRRRERQHVDRARRAMERCIELQHTVDEEDG